MSTERWVRHAVTHFLDTHATDGASEASERDVAIVDQKTRSRILGKRLAELLGRPRGRGMRRHGDVHDATTIVR